MNLFFHRTGHAFRFDGTGKPAGKVGTAKCGVAVRVGIHSLADDLHVARKPEVRVKRRPLRAFDTVRRPRAAAFFKAHVVGRMPIPGRKNRNAAGFRLGNPSIQYGNDGVAVAHSQGSARTKVILHVDDQKRIAAFKAHIDIVILPGGVDLRGTPAAPRFRPSDLLLFRNDENRHRTVTPPKFARI